MIFRASIFLVTVLAGLLTLAQEPLVGAKISGGPKQNYLIYGADERFTPVGGVNGECAVILLDVDYSEVENLISSKCALALATIVLQGSNIIDDSTNVTVTLSFFSKFFDLKKWNIEITAEDGATLEGIIFLRCVEKTDKRTFGIICRAPLAADEKPYIALKDKAGMVFKIQPTDSRSEKF